MFGLAGWLPVVPQVVVVGQRVENESKTWGKARRRSTCASIAAVTLHDLDLDLDFFWVAAMSERRFRKLRYPIVRHAYRALQQRSRGAAEDVLRGAAESLDFTAFHLGDRRARALSWRRGREGGVSCSRRETGGIGRRTGRRTEF